MQRSSTLPRAFSPFLHPGGLVPGWGGMIDWAQVSDAYLVNNFAMTVNGALIAGATTLVVDSVPYPLKDQQILRHPTGAIIVDGDVAAGETNIPIAPLDFAVADNAVITAQQEGAKLVKRILQGTAMVKLASGKMVPRAIRPGAETAFAVLTSDALSEDRTAAKSGYGVTVGGTPLLENLLPDADLNGDFPYKAELAANGCTFTYVDYTDDTRHTLP